MEISIAEFPREDPSFDNAETTLQNFYDAFGTSGCLLTCDLKRQYQEYVTTVLPQPGIQNSVRRQKKKETDRTYRELNRNFTLAELLSSIRSGCGSCEVLKELLERVSLIDPDDYRLEANTTLNVSPAFVLERQTLKNDTLEVQQIHLFSPLGCTTQFRNMPRVSFLRGNTASSTSINRASMWLKNCVDTHLICRPNITSELPSRIIDVTEIKKGDEKGVRLVKTSFGEAGKYACLSHCWGKALIQCCTTRATLHQATEFIGFNSMPQNFRDAVEITRKLQLQYLWIDSICILQGDRQDWEVESGKMAAVYKNSYITIAAAASADSTGGCFTRTKPDICLRISWNHSEPFVVGARMCDTKGFLRDEKSIKERQPLLQRGWVYQERLLSPRTLYCNYGELAFRCLESSTCECGKASIAPHGSAASIGTGRKGANLLLARAIPDWKFLILDYWRDMVSKYMRLSLTQLSDILPAISGCARQLSELTGDKYVAGIWRKSFANYLLWHIKDSRKSRARPKWNAPTWSWASMASGQELLFFEKVNVDCLKQLLSSSVINRIQCVPKSDRNPFGEISPGTGSLRFHAQLFRCHIRYFCVSSKRALDMAGGMKHQRHYRLHQQKYRQKYDKVSIKLCDLPVPGVDTRGGTFDLLPDIPLRDALEWRESQVCENCKLAQISLLQVGNVTEGNMRRDYFMMLRAIGVGVGSYERIGLATLLRQTVDQRKVWFEEVWQKGALPPEEITIN